MSAPEHTPEQLEPNTDDMRTHLEMLFGGELDGHHEGLIEIAVSDATGNPNKSRLFGTDKFDEAIEYASIENTLRRNVYVGATLKKPSTAPFGRTKDADTLCATCLWVDCDKDGAALQAQHKWGTLAPSLFALTGKKPHARAHFYYRLETPLTDQARIRTLEEVLVGRFNGDTQAKNPGRLMRLIGSVAWPLGSKKERAPEMTRIVALKRPGLPRYPVEQLEKEFGVSAPMMPTSTSTSTSSREPGYFGLDTHKPARTDQELTELLKSTRPGKWHEPMRDAIASMVGRGWTDYQIKLACAPYCDDGEDDPDLVELIDGARVKFSKPDVDGALAKPAERGDYFPDVGIIDETKIERRSFLYGRHYIRKYASATIATGGTGKSSLVLVEALAMVSGRPLLGVKPAHRCRVAIWNGEDPLDELQRRLAAAMKKHGVKPEDCVGYLSVQSGRRVPIQLASLINKLGATVNEEVLQAIVAELKAKQIDVLVIDPFISSHGVPENDNNGIDAVVKAWARIAELANCAVELVHHSRKTRGEEVGVEDSRGASALLAAVRSARSINSMSKEEAKQVGIENPRLYFKAENGKANMAPPPPRADWFQLVPIELANGDGLHPGDQVAVVEKWTWPDLLAGYTAEHAERVFAKVRAGQWLASSGSPRWVGVAVADALDLDLDKDADKAKAVAWIKEAIATKTLKKVKDKDIETRHERTFVVVADAQK